MNIQQKEKEVLNLYCDNSELFDKCSNLIFDEVWSTNFNRVKFKIIEYNHQRGKKSDILLLENMLKKSEYKFGNKEIALGIGEPDYRIAKNVEEYVKDIFDEYCKRKLLPKLNSISSELDSEVADVSGCMEGLKSTIGDIEAIKNNLSIERSIIDIHDEAFKELLEAQDKGDELIGYSYGLKDLDKLTCGAKQEVILVIAPPAAGKSSLMVNIIKHIAIKQKAPVLIHSLEMPAKQLIKNIWANALEINSYGIRSGQLSDEDLLKIKKFRDILKDNLVIDDTSGITWQYIETKVRRMRKKIPMDKVIVVMVDYVQIMRNTPEETKGIGAEEQQSLRANGLMELSKKYNLCLIELSQIGRETGKRDNKEPTISDAKGSGSWEANAVQCWALFRPDYYEKDPTEDGMSLKGLCKIKILKNRYGNIGDLYARFKGQYSAFENYNQDSNDIQTGNKNGGGDVF